jgi:CBS domain-containing protein
MKVREIMTVEPRCAAPDTTLEEIATLMKEEDVGVVPVVEDGEVTGVVTDRDIVVRCIAAGKNPAECTAEDIMSEEVRSIEPNADLDDAANIMAEIQVRRLPVIEGGRLIGMITLGDIAVKAADEEEDTTAETLEEVSQGVKPSRGGKRASGRENEGEDVEEENELEVTGSAGRQTGGSRAKWNQGDREVMQKGADKRRVASAATWEGGRGEREEGRVQKRNGGRGSQQPGVRGRGERSERRESNRGVTMGARGRDSRDQRDRGRVQQTGETRRTSERGRPEKVGHGEQGISMRKAPQGQGISNRAAGRENARQSKVAPKRAEARGNRNAKRRAS